MRENENLINNSYSCKGHNYYCTRCKAEIVITGAYSVRELRRLGWELLYGWGSRCYVAMSSLCLGV